MIPYVVYKIVHYAGIFLMVVAASTALARATVLVTGAIDSKSADPWGRRLVAAHGFALFLILLGGFGMLARLGITEGLSLPGWIWAKLVIWTLLGGIVAARRSAARSTLALIVLPALAVLAGWIAVFKPF